MGALVLKYKEFVILMMNLKEFGIQDEYRSDTNNIKEDFFVPCFTNCIEYNRCAVSISTDALFSIATRLQRITNGSMKMKLVIGNNFVPKEMTMLASLFADGEKPIKGMWADTVKRIRAAIKDDIIQIRISVPNSNAILDSISSRIGIFKDDQNNMVAFTGTIRDATTHLTNEFDVIEVFTSWNDPQRVDRKVVDFEQIWQNKATFMDVYDFVKAENLNLLKYSADWLLKY